LDIGFYYYQIALCWDRAALVLATKKDNK
jgi:hypothetical protein